MNNYVITGSTGHISKPVIEGLVKAGKNVSVVTHSTDRVKEIESLGAKAEVGSIQDVEFLESAFKDAEVAYTMIPAIWSSTDLRTTQNEVAANYIEAIKANNVKYVVNLSSIGAHQGQGVGPVNGLHDFEEKLNTIPDLNVKHLRPSYFFYNFLNQIDLIKHAGIMGANFGEGEKLFLIHTNDIASAALEELLNLNFKGNSVRYILGDERSGKEIAHTLGKAIGKDLNWVLFTDEQQKQGLLQAGLPETFAQNYTEMGMAIREGRMQADVRMNVPSLSPTKLEDFAKEFTEAYNSRS